MGQFEKHSPLISLANLDREQINQQWIDKGVIIVDPATTYITSKVVLAASVVIYPNSYLLGETQVGQGSVIGPNTYVEDSQIGENCTLRFSVVEQAVIENKVEVVPFAHLRKGSHLADGVQMGNFGEVKNSYLGSGTKMGHFSYLGDAQIGSNVNIGAGTITCNYDGVHKHQTIIEDDTFIGSDTMLVAPLKIGRNAKTGAGSVVTQDVPDNTLVYGVPARSKQDKST